MCPHSNELIVKNGTDPRSPIPVGSASLQIVVSGPFGHLQTPCNIVS